MDRKDTLKREISKLIDTYWEGAKVPTDSKVLPLKGFHIDESSSYPGDLYVSLPINMTAKGVTVGGVKATWRVYSPRPNVQFWYVKGDLRSLSGKEVLVESGGKTYRASVPKVFSAGKTHEDGRYHGRGNGDRATWYFKGRMESYPKELRVVIPGFLDRTIVTNGKRYDRGGLLLKQSDVRGRGMALLVDKRYKGKSCKIYY